MRAIGTGVGSWVEQRLTVNGDGTLSIPDQRANVERLEDGPRSEGTGTPNGPKPPAVPLNLEKLVEMLGKARDASRRTIVPRLHDLFSYMETTTSGNDSFGRYEADHQNKWAAWGEGRNMGAWDMPLDVEDRKSLAYHLYRSVLEANRPGCDITHWMYHDRFDVNIAEFQRYFLEWFAAAISDIYSDSRPVGDPQPESQDKESGQLFKDVFIVHGHDVAAKLEVAYLLKKLDLNPIILHEQADGGRTIIEKLEHESRRAGFAIVILSPDDQGSVAGAADLKPRARQNVVFEWGMFVGLLGRGGVCALKKGDAEIPSDMQGVLWKNMDGSWQYELAKEMKRAGLEVDLNKL